ncbi:MAG: galactokinase [Ilumatobacteraceae bacterium]|nr:galactokinase [Ilumatobacteraceae bacterium]
MQVESAVERAQAAHRDRWGRPDLVVRAPGRVNLIGEHTDYNDGFTLPMALPFDTVLAISNDGDPTTGPVTIVSAGFGEIEIDPSADPRETEAWAQYVAGAVHVLAGHDVPTGGWRATVETDIPTGASLSSSAAIEVATITAMLARTGTTWSPIDVARLGQRVENEVVGIPSGIMDQFISAGAVDGHASLMDCRALTLTPTLLPDDVVVAIIDSGTRRKLAEAAYGDRRASCRRATEALGVVALRDATVEQVVTIADPVDRRRAHHIVTENQRTLDAVDALDRHDTARFGELMRASHISLRDDFEVSGPGLDAIVAVADDAPGCIGARMTGGGFAGCAVALVEADRADDFRRDVVDRYAFDGHTARVWICAPSAGASVIDG